MPVVGIDCVFINKKYSQAARYVWSTTDAEHPSSAILGAGDFYSGVPLTWPCALDTHHEGIFQCCLTCRESPAV